MLKHRVGELRDRENEHEIEEQLDVSDAMMPVRGSLPQQRVALLQLRHRSSHSAELN